MPNNEYLVTNAELTATADAIRVKAGSSSPIEWKSNNGFADSIGSIPTGRVEADYSKPVKFYDYDGFLVYSYTPEEFSALTAMPENPSHEGLTAQGWNWTLAQAKTYVTAYGMLDVGQMYTTSDGKTRLKIRLEEGRLSPYLGLAVNGSADIDWGDGSAHNTITGSSSSTVVYENHDYAHSGEYIIAISVTGSATIVGGNSYANLLRSTSEGSAATSEQVYRNTLIEVYLGSNISIGDSAFNSCTMLKCVALPMNSMGNKTYVFNSCSSLSFVALPSGTTYVGVALVRNCFALRSISLPYGLTTVNSNSFYSSSVASFVIPNTLTMFANSIFYYCTSLTKVVMVDSVTYIGTNMFNGCYGLKSVRFCSNTPPTVSASNAWSNISDDLQILYPYASTIAYKSATNYPNISTYLYLGFYTGTDGETLPTTVTDGTTTYDLTWYANTKDAVAETNPITAMQGTEVYCRSVLAA